MRYRVAHQGAGVDSSAQPDSSTKVWFLHAGDLVEIVEMVGFGDLVENVEMVGFGGDLSRAASEGGSQRVAGSAFRTPPKMGTRGPILTAQRRPSP